MDAVLLLNESFSQNYACLDEVIMEYSDSAMEV